jgi:hypothetical protein
MGEFKRIISDLKDDELSEVLIKLCTYQKQYIEDFCSVLDQRNILEQSLSELTDYNLLECASKLNSLDNSTYFKYFINVISERGLSKSFINYKAETEKKSLFSSSNTIKISSVSVVLLILVLFKFCIRQEGGKIQEKQQAEIQQIKQKEFDQRMEDELSLNSTIDSCFLILQKKLDGHKKDIDSVKKYHPKSLSLFIENLISNDGNVSGFIDSNFYKTDFSEQQFQLLKANLLKRYNDNFERLVLNY